MRKLKTPATGNQPEPQGLEIKTGRIVTQNNIEELDSGECELIGPERFLVPEGDYQAIYTHYETASVFQKKVNGFTEGGKLYLWFRIDPYKISSLDPRDNVYLFISYNASSVLIPTGMNGKFKMTRGKKFVQDFERLIGTVKRRDRISPNNFKNMLVNVHVHTVTKNQHQKDHPEATHYSVIDQIKEIHAG